MLISDRPKWTGKILNLEKDIEARKKVDTSFRGWVYIYCTLNGGRLLELLDCEQHCKLEKECDEEDLCSSCDILNGKVVARYYCDDIYTYDIQDPRTWEDKEFGEYVIKHIGMTLEELHAYAGDKVFYGMHITNLEIFDKPKLLSEFWSNGKKIEGHSGTYQYTQLTKAPQSYCFINIGG